MHKVIIQEKQKVEGEEKDLFYIREIPYRPGYSYQATATTREAAEWILKGGWNS